MQQRLLGMRIGAVPSRRVPAGSVRGRSQHAKRCQQIVFRGDPLVGGPAQHHGGIILEVGGW